MSRANLRKKGFWLTLPEGKVHNGRIGRHGSRQSEQATNIFNCKCDAEKVNRKSGEAADSRSPATMIHFL